MEDLLAFEAQVDVVFCIDCLFDIRNRLGDEHGPPF
jgi:hypothetical protein